MSTRDNIYYTKMRDDIEAQYKRLKNVKTKEMEAQNEKMYGKLLSILDNEKRSLSKHKPVGPISLNVGVRRRTINTINNENEVISKKLNDIKCQVPTKEKLDNEFKKAFSFKRAVSTRKASGEPKLDPLISKRRQFEIATSDFATNFDNLYRNTHDAGPIKKLGESTFSEDIAPMYNMTLKSHRMESAKKSLPFNINNMSKHSVKAKLNKMENSPKSSTRELFKNSTNQLEFTK